MARVSLLFEDAEGEEVAFRADYQGGYDATSNSHKLSNQVIKFLEQNAETIKDEEVHTTQEELNDPATAG